MRANLRPALLASLACTLACALAAAAAPLGAQDRDEPKRPKLPEGADTNSAASYHQFGLASMRNNPRRAADAFYWAGRIEPGAGTPQYARYVALLLEDRRTAVRYWLGDEGLTRSKQIRRIDSLAYRALLRDPFMPRGLYSHITNEAIYQITGMAVLPTSNEYPEFNAQQAYDRGDYAQSAMWYARAIKKYPRAYILHDWRADALFLTQQYDSTVAELQQVLEAQRKRDAKKLVYAYESKAMTEFKIGWALAHKGDLPGAREAYGRALAEDIAFWRAHEALADVALAQGDSTVALQELDLAAQIATTDAALLDKYAVLLLTKNRLDDAAAALQKAIAAEPFYARPYFLLAVVLERQGKKAEAVEQYRAFLARASNGADGVAIAREKVTSLAAGGS